MLMHVTLRDFDVDVPRYPRLIVFPQFRKAVLERTYDKSTPLRHE